MDTTWSLDGADSAGATHTLGGVESMGGGDVELP